MIGIKKKKNHHPIYILKKLFMAGFLEYGTLCNGSVSFCKVCEVKVTAHKKFTVQQQITHIKHLRWVKKKKIKNKEPLTSLTQPMCSEIGNYYFNRDLFKAFLSAKS